MTKQTYRLDVSKIKTGWKAFYWSYQDWLDAMVSEDYVKEFFDYLGSCADL